MGAKFIQPCTLHEGHWVRLQAESRPTPCLACFSFIPGLALQVVCRLNPALHAAQKGHPGHMMYAPPEWSCALALGLNWVQHTYHVQSELQGWCVSCGTSGSTGCICCTQHSRLVQGTCTLLDCLYACRAGLVGEPNAVCAPD